MQASAAAARRGVRMMSGGQIPAPASFTSVRTLGSMGPWMVAQPNQVKELQKFFGHTNAYTFEKGAADKFYNSGILFVSVSCMLLVGSGACGCLPRALRWGCCGALLARARDWPLRARSKCRGLY